METLIVSDMIQLRQRTIWQRFGRLWPPELRRQDLALEIAIEALCDDPSLPCMVDGVLIPHGYGSNHDAE